MTENVQKDVEKEVKVSTRQESIELQKKEKEVKKQEDEMSLRRAVIDTVFAGQQIGRAHV